MITFCLVAATISPINAHKLQLHKTCDMLKYIPECISHPEGIPQDYSWFKQILDFL